MLPLMILDDAAVPEPVAVIVEQVVDDAATPDPMPPAPPAPTVSPASLPAGWGAGLWARFPARVEIDARCIAHHESWTAGLWRAVNRGRGTSASGFGQWEDGSWQVQAARAGVGTEYARAYLAPPAVQAAVFAFQDLRHGLYPWAGTGCPGT